MLSFPGLPRFPPWFSFGLSPPILGLSTDGCLLIDSAPVARRHSPKNGFSQGIVTLTMFRNTEQMSPRKPRNHQLLDLA